MNGPKRVSSVIAHSTGSVILVVVVALFAGLARGFAGFGAALIFIPVASAAIGPKEASPILLLVDMVLTTALLPNALRIADKKEIATMAIGAAIGIPVGATILASLPSTMLRWGICAVVVFLLVFLISGWRYGGRPKTRYTIGVGVVGGVFSGAAQLGGPPVIAYWLGGGHVGRTVRSNVILYFAVSSLFSLVSYSVAGLIGQDTLAVALFCAPCYGAGILLGSRLFGVAREETFRRICFVLIGLSALAGMPVLDGLFK